MRRRLLLGGMVLGLSALVLPVPALARTPSDAAEVRARLAGVRLVHPGGAVARVRVRVAGAHALTVDAEGALVARTGLRSRSRRYRNGPCSPWLRC